MKTLFDENGLLNIADITKNHPSFKAIMDNGIVTDQELRTQAENTVAALQRVQALCNNEQQAAIVDAFSEMSVLYAAYHYYELQNLTK